MTTTDGAARRLEGWQRSLLDLTLRNRLLDARDGRTVVTLAGVDAVALATALEPAAEATPDGARPLELVSYAAPDAAALGGPERAAEAIARAATEALAARRLLVALAGDELDRRLVAMARAAREAMSEAGASTLWLCLGTLAWRERDADDARPRRAPLVMVPVELRRAGAGDRYRVTVVDGEDWRWNDTLVEKLKDEHGLTLAPPARSDDGALDVTATLDAVAGAIAARPGWEVARDARLAVLSFTKFVMWTDLRERGAALLRAPVVAHLAAGGSTPFPGGELPAGGDLDLLAPGELFAPLDCDASQLAAVLAAAAGRTFVLQGPPGTGKSQTITNLIAQCLAAGKSVLFVAEKMAALEVVQRRLTAAGLGDFCLEVHSHKARKREVVTELARVLERVWRPNTPVAGDDQRLAAARDELNRYVAALHAPGAAGMSVHDALGRLGELAGAWRLDGDVGVRGVTAEVVAVRREAVARLAQAATAIDPVALHPWHGSTLETWPVEGQARVAAAVAAARAAGEALARAVASLPAVVPGLAARTRAQLEALGELAEKVAATPRPGAELIMAAGPGGGAAGASGGAGAGRSAIDDRIALVKARAGGATTTALARTPRLTLDAAPRDPATWLTLVRQRRELDAALAGRWSPRVYELELERLVGTFERWAGRFFLFRWFALRKPRQEVRRALMAGVALPDDATVARDLDQARIVEKTDVLLDAARPAARAWLGALAAAADDGELAPVERALAWAGELAACFDRVEVDGDRAAAWRALVAAVSGEPDDAPAAAAVPERAGGGGGGDGGSGGGGGGDDGHAVGPEVPAPGGLDAFAAVARATAAWREALAGLAETCGVTVGDGAGGEGGGDAGGGHLAALAARCATWAAAPGALRDWTAYARARKAAIAAGLGEVVAQVEAETVADDHLVAAWERALVAAIAEDGVAAAPALATFHGATHHARIAEFVELDRAQLGVARARTIARLAERVPKVSADVADGGEIGVLLHEARKQRRHRPLRALFRDIPGLLTRLKPCLLMSPLSVAQYLDPEADGFTGFDLVVFDEASQIPTADAIGALARGKAAVIVGDSRQLPPTRFFEPGGDVAPAASEPGDEDDVEELESILDDGVAARLPELRLSWHYRSRHEDLIAFSNERYYGGGLDVFPAAAARTPELGVSWRKVDGAYDRAGTRTNPAEARAVVAEVVARLSDPERAARSIGVVTFGRPQQELVLDLLDDARRRQPELERHFGAEVAEPVLVKNLETIQGDERDVMLFSIGYGPDAAGKVTMNFGPLNRAGGERRLNVAVTRAREQLVVFSTLEPEQIAEEGAALGVRHLAELLRYARGDGRGAAARDERPPATALGRAIGLALAARGWHVHHQVGCAGYRVDVAVLDPDDPGRYVLGIETDGPSYARARTARDRDRLRTAVMANLGWRLYRIWSLDWWDDPEKEAQRVHNAVIAAIAAARAARAPRRPAPTRPPGATPTAATATPTAPARKAPAAPAAASAQATSAATVGAATGIPAPIDAAPTTPTGGAPSAVATEASGKSKRSGRAAGKGGGSRGASAQLEIPAAPGGAPAVAPYQVAGVPAGRRKPDDLFEPTREAELGKVVDAVLAVEAPIRLGLLARRVGAYCGIGRVTARVVDRVKALAVARGRVGRDGDADVVWRTDQDAAAWPVVRVPGAGGETRRDVDEIPLVEIAGAVLVVLHRNIGLPVAELTRETAKLLGFTRQGEVVKRRVAEGLAEAAARGGCVVDGERVRLP